MLGNGGETLLILTSFVILIIIGLIITTISKKLKISNIFFLIIAGLILGHFFSGSEFFKISNEAILTIAIFGLVIVVFDGSSRFKLKSLDTLSGSALKLTGLFLFFNLALVGLLTTYLFFDFSFTSIFYSLVFAAIISGTDPASVFIMLQNRTNKVIEFLKIEGVLNTPIMVVLPFIIMDVMNQILTQNIISFQDYLSNILTQILVGIGAGIVVGIIFFKGMKKFSEQTSALTLICSALLAFILAENLGGNGVLAVAVLGFMFGAFYLSKKEALLDFSGMLSNSLEILVFITLGFIVTININLVFILKSLAIFAALVLTRYLAVKLALYKENYTTRELIYMTLNMPKGIAVAVLIFSLSFLKAPEIIIINNLLVTIILYSLILATITNAFSDKFINVKL